MDTRILRVPHVVIVGGGFGGLTTARSLRRAPVTLTLIDRRNHHLFQPLLYQAVSTGATHAYFGHPEWARVAPGLKSIEDATEIRRRFLLAFEAAEQEPDPAERRALLTFVAVGAGPTGVEMAGSMVEVARRSIVRDFRAIRPQSARIVLLEGGPRVLAAYDEELSAYALRALERMGVEVRTGAIVTRIEPDAVYVGDERIPTRNVVWGAGVTASPLGGKLGAPTDRVGRVVVEPDCSIPGHPEVFVIGDLASFTDADTGRQLPGVAPVANQMGEHVARAIRATVEGAPRRPFRYRDKGSMATIGRRAAVVQVGKVKMKGWLAWLAWLFVHILFLIGFRNRLLVMTQWAWSYLTWQRGARLITGEVGPDLAPPGKPLGTPPEDQATFAGAEEAAARWAERAGTGTPADAEATGWMGGDRSQAGTRRG